LEPPRRCVLVHLRQRGGLLDRDAAHTIGTVKFIKQSMADRLVISSNDCSRNVYANCSKTCDVVWLYLSD
jgi:hypothetical protein